MAGKRKPVGVKKKKPVPRAGTERPFNGGTWSTPRFFGFIRSSLRRASSRWGPIYTCLAEAEVGKRINAKSGRLAMHYRCSSCGNELPRKEVQVDHIVEAGSLRSFDDLPGFCRRLFVEREGLCVLCLTCHHQKTHQ